MSLVDYPVTHRRQKAAIGNQVAEQKRMVRDDDISHLGAAASTVYEAEFSEKRALTPEALA